MITEYPTSRGPKACFRRNAPGAWSDIFIHPEDDPRAGGGFENPERAILTGYLHDRRLIPQTKCSGLEATDLARRSVQPSNLSLLGLVRHMVGVEQSDCVIVCADPTPALLHASRRGPYRCHTCDRRVANSG
ncbi:MAG: DUF664 domain-containing protein [Mycobacteriales bacterium]